MDAIAWLLITFVLLLLLTRWLAKHIQGIGYLLTGDGHAALTTYLLVTLPGVLLHEISHAAMALLLFVKVRRLSIGLSSRRGRQVTLGSVDIARTDPIRASLIGLAPLIAGCGVILLINQLVFDLPAWLRKEGFWQALGDVYQTPNFWLWVYLVFAIGNAMFPSAADRHAWGTTLLFIFFVGAVLYFAGLLDEVSQAVGNWFQSAAAYLAYAFGMTVIIDVVLMVILFLVEQGLSLLSGKQIKYH